MSQPTKAGQVERDQRSLSPIKDLLRQIINEPVSDKIPEPKIEIMLRRLIDDTLTIGDTKTTMWILETLEGKPFQTQITHTRDGDMDVVIE